MTCRIRGIYATGLTDSLADEPGVVQASSAIEERFDAAEFPTEPARATIDTTDDRQGVGVDGDPETVAAILERLAAVGIDALAWRDPHPRGGIYDGTVRETLGSGAVVALEASDGAEQEAMAEREDTAGQDAPALSGYPPAVRDGTGFLPYRNVDDRVEAGDRVRVQVREPAPPWGADRPVLDTAIRVDGTFLSLQRGSVTGTGGPHLGDVLPTDPPDGWGVRWTATSEEAGLDALDDALSGAAERAETIEDALSRANDRADPVDDALERESSDEAATGRIESGRETAWVWFGRESRFALDELRRQVTPTMPGHHRIKAGADAASPAVDFVESLCPDLGDERADEGEGAGGEAGVDFPFGVATEHFGPAVGDAVAIHHGKPDGRRITLGEADVERVGTDGTVTLRRTLTSSGTYDGLGTTREHGDVATTKVVEGRWWYPTVYRSADGDHRGTYVNVCTPVEVFPGAVRYVDLHVDVVKRPDGTVERLDDDELDAAESAGRLAEPLANRARSVASAVEGAL